MPPSKRKFSASFAYPGSANDTKSACGEAPPRRRQGLAIAPSTSSRPGSSARARNTGWSCSYTGRSLAAGRPRRRKRARTTGISAGVTSLIAAKTRSGGASSAIECRSRKSQAGKTLSSLDGGIEQAEPAREIRLDRQLFLQLRLQLE